MTAVENVTLTQALEALLCAVKTSAVSGGDATVAIKLDCDRKVDAADALAVLANHVRANDPFLTAAFAAKKGTPASMSASKPAVSKAVVRSSKPVRLPDDVWSVVLKFLTLQDRVRVGRVSKQFRRASMAGHLWRSIDMRAVKGIDTKALGKAARFMNRTTHVDLGGQARINNDAVMAVADACPDLVSLDLSECTLVDDKAMALLVKHCPKLKHIAVAGTSVTDDGIARLAASLPLESLNMSHCRVTDAAVVALANTRITSLTAMFISRLSDLSLRALATNGERLRELRFKSSRDFTDQGVAHLAERCGKLQVLALNGADRLTDAAVAAVAEFCPDMRELDLAWCSRVSDAGVAALGVLDKLEAVNLSGMFNVTDDAVEQLVVGNKPLKHVCVPRTRVSDQGLAAVAKASGATLRHVEAWDNARVTDAALQALAVSCQRLQIVDVYNCTGVTNVGLQALLLGEAGTGGRLECVDVRACGVTRELARHVLETHPHIKVKWWGGMAA